jgi:hypothetical protein
MLRVRLEPPDQLEGVQVLETLVRLELLGLPVRQVILETPVQLGILDQMVRPVQLAIQELEILVQRVIQGGLDLLDRLVILDQLE